MNSLVADSVAISGQVVQVVNFWMWIAIAESIVILYLTYLLLIKKRQGRKDVKEKLKSSPVDFENTISSAFNSKPLYDNLKVRCHPDRFINTPLEKVANAIFQEIQENRYDYQKLRELENRAVQELHITLNR